MFCCCAEEGLRTAPVENLVVPQPVLSELPVEEVVEQPVDDVQDVQDVQAERPRDDSAPQLLGKPGLANQGSMISNGRTVGKTATGPLTNIDDLDPLVQKLVSFKGSLHLLRASRLTTVMWRGAAIFLQAAGSEATYALSEEVTAITAFISHNWSVPRSSKFFCLALHYNFHLALVVAILAMVVIGALTLAGRLPLIVLQEGVEEPGICATLLVAPIFMLTVCCGQELRRMIGYLNPRVFLDKTCIHQTDAGLQKEGILKLGAFIQCSSDMIVIYSDVYLRKLWTVYEVACFLSLHPTSKLSVVPPFKPLAALGGVASFYIGGILGMLIKLATKTGGHTLQGFNVLWLVFCIFCWLLLTRRLARMRLAIRQRVESFRVENCICAEESDRPLVFRNIALLMRATGALDPDAADEDAPGAFNVIVRARLLGPLANNVRPEYLHFVALHACAQAPVYVDGYFGIRPFPGPAGTETHVRISLLLDLAMWSLAFIPFWSLLVIKFCERCIHLTGWREVAFLMLTCAAVVFVSIAIIALQLVLDALCPPHQVAGVVVRGVSLALLFLLTILFFESDRRPREQTEEEEA